MKIIFMGRKGYGAEALKWTVEQGIEVVCVCTDSQLTDSQTAAMATHLKIPVWSMEEAENYVFEHPNVVELVISYLYWRKIKEPLISIPKYGCINFHPALLPEWRGLAGYNIAILKKLKEWGATAHYVNESIDTGDIIKIFKFNFDYRNETAQSMEIKTQNIQIELYKSVMRDVIEHGRLKAEKQSLKSGRYISRREMLEMMKLDMNHLENEELDLKIRAFWSPPHSGAGFEYDGKFYTIVNDEILKTLSR